MASPPRERAIGNALRCGHAVLGFDSANDVGFTEFDQRGYCLSRLDDVRPILTPQKPEKSLACDHRVRIVWQNGHLTLRISKGSTRMAGGCSSPGSARFGTRGACDPPCHVLGRRCTRRAPTQAAHCLN